MYELNRQYKFKAPRGAISPTGIRAVEEFIEQQDITERGWAEKNPDFGKKFMPPLPLDWVWMWKDDNGVSFPKRTRRYYYQTYQLKVTNEFLRKMGNLAKSHTENNVAYTFDFVNTFDWMDGDFGDAGSCYWGGNDGARAMLTDHHAMAIRFFDADNNGVARAWVVRPDDNKHIVFNGYGFAGDPTQIIARVLAGFLGVYYRRVRLTNCGDDEGVLWINGGGGYVIGATEHITNFEQHDFGWEEIDLY